MERFGCVDRASLPKGWRWPQPLSTGNNAEHSPAAELVLVHHVHDTAANVADVTEVPHLLHGDENVICADAGCTGVEKRPGHGGRPVIWQIAARRSTYISD